MCGAIRIGTSNPVLVEAGKVIPRKLIIDKSLIHVQEDIILSRWRFMRIEKMRFWQQYVETFYQLTTDAFEERGKWFVLDDKMAMVLGVYYDTSDKGWRGGIVTQQAFGPVSKVHNRMPYLSQRWSKELVS